MQITSLNSCDNFNLNSYLIEYAHVLLVLGRHHLLALLNDELIVGAIRRHTNGKAVSVCCSAGMHFNRNPEKTETLGATVQISTNESNYNDYLN